MEFDSLIDDHNKNEGDQTQQPGGHGDVVHFVGHGRLNVYPELQVQERLDDLAQQPATQRVRLNGLASHRKASKASISALLHSLGILFASATQVESAGGQMDCLDEHVGTNGQDDYSVVAKPGTLEFNILRKESKAREDKGSSEAV